MSHRIDLLADEQWHRTDQLHIDRLQRRRTTASGRLAYSGEGICQEQAQNRGNMFDGSRGMFEDIPRVGTLAVCDLVQGICGGEGCVIARQGCGHMQPVKADPSITANWRVP